MHIEHEHTKNIFSYILNILTTSKRMHLILIFVNIEVLITKATNKSSHKITYSRKIFFLLFFILYKIPLLMSVMSCSYAIVSAVTSGH